MECDSERHINIVEKKGLFNYSECCHGTGLSGVNENDGNFVILEAIWKYLPLRDMGIIIIMYIKIELATMRS